MLIQKKKVLQQSQTCMKQMEKTSLYKETEVIKKNQMSKGYMHPNVHCSSVYNHQDVEAT